PADALEALGTERVDLLIAGFMMPDMDGISLLTRARALTPPTTRILLTGYADTATAIRAIHPAALYYYPEKPCDNEQLKVIIRNGIERCELFRELDDRGAAREKANLELHGLRARLMQAFL